MSGMPWIKLWTSSLDDSKLVGLSETDQLRFIKLICLAGRCDAGGALAENDKPLSVEEIAWRMRSTDVASWEETVDTLLDKDMMQDDDGILVITNFIRYQGPAQAQQREAWRKRQREHRERIKGNGHVSQNVTGDTLKREIEIKSKSKKKREVVTRDTPNVTRDILMSQNVTCDINNDDPDVKASALLLWDIRSFIQSQAEIKIKPDEEYIIDDLLALNPSVTRADVEGAIAWRSNSGLPRATNLRHLSGAIEVEWKKRNKKR